MGKGIVSIFGGEGKGKTSAAIGQGLKAANEGKSVVIIQFLKGKTTGEFDIIKRLEPEIKLFCFEKSAECFDDLSPERQREEIQNIRNGLNFAKKVLVTGECDMLILDEFLGLIDNKIMSIDDLKTILAAKPDDVSIIITGINIPQEIEDSIDEITKLETVKFSKVR